MHRNLNVPPTKVSLLTTISATNTTCAKVESPRQSSAQTAWSSMNKSSGSASVTNLSMSIAAIGRNCVSLKGDFYDKINFPNRMQKRRRAPATTARVKTESSRIPMRLSVTFSITAWMENTPRRNVPVDCTSTKTPELACGRKLPTARTAKSTRKS